MLLVEVEARGCVTEVALQNSGIEWYSHQQPCPALLAHMSGSLRTCALFQLSYFLARRGVDSPARSSPVSNATNTTCEWKKGHRWLRP